MHIFTIEDGGLHWYSAETATEALQLYKKDVGEMEEDTIVEQLPDDQSLAIVMAHEENQPKVTKLASEWVLEGKGCVASTEY